MNYEIVKIGAFCGRKTIVYSIIPEDSEYTLFDDFLKEYVSDYKNEINEITSRLSSIAHDVGIRDSFLKHEGNREFTKKYGKYVYALYDTKKSNLRLYCIKLSGPVLILGGGGYKSKDKKTWQEDEKLSQEVYKIMDYAVCILKQLDKKDLFYSSDGSEIIGQLKNY